MWGKGLRELAYRLFGWTSASASKTTVKFEAFSQWEVLSAKRQATDVGSVFFRILELYHFCLLILPLLALFFFRILWALAFEIALDYRLGSYSAPPRFYLS